MRKKSLPLLAALLLIPAASYPQSIIGIVQEDSTRLAIRGATVDLLTLNGARRIAALTDSMGAFRLSPEREGIFRLRVRHPSYAEFTSDTISLHRQQVIAVELRMAAQAIPIEPLVVASRMNDRLLGYHERLARRTWGRFVTREEIDMRPAARATELLYGLPGVEIVRAGGGTGGPTTNLITVHRGAGRCMPALFLDGIPLQQYADPAPVGIDELLDPTILEGVEVYPGLAGVPSELNAVDNSCGIVAFWTRPFQRSAAPATAMRMVKNWMLVMVVGAFVATGLRTATH